MSAKSRDRHSNVPKFRMEPGSYGGPGRSYMPSIACMQQSNASQWRHHFVLVKPGVFLTTEDEATAQAEQDLNRAFGEHAAANQVAESLKLLGYKSVEGFNIVASGTPPPSNG